MIQIQAIFVLTFITISWAGVVPEDDTVSQSESGIQKIIEKLYEQGKLNRLVQKHIKHHEKHDDEHHRDDDHHHHDEPSTTNIQTFNVYYKKRSDDSADLERDRMCRKCRGDECNGCGTRSGNNVVVDEIADMLDELEGELELESVAAINEQATKCRGRFVCYQGRNSNHEGRDHLRCGCSRPRVDFEGRDNLRCIGNRCGQDRDDIDEEERGNRDESDEIRHQRRDRHDLRCIGDRCGGNRLDRHDLRCEGNRCGGQTSDRHDTRDRDDLRCRGNRCGRGRLGVKTRPENYVEDSPGRNVKVYKINDDIDAIAMNVPDLSNILNEIVKPNSNKSRFKKVLENIDMETLLREQSKGDVDTIVIDLSKMKDSDILAKRIKNLMLADKNKLLIAREVNTLDSEKELNLASKLFSTNQKRLLEVQKLGVPNVQASDSMIAAHDQNNNNVYVPKWLHDVALIKGKLRQKDLIDSVVQPMILESETKPPKRLFPLTQKQKSRLQMKQLMKEKHRPRSHWHQENDVGFPFELQVQGLGQVNP